MVLKPRIYSSEPNGFKKPSQHQKYVIEDPERYLKRLLIYYSKNLQALKPIIAEMENHQFNPSIKKLYKKLVSKYKKDFCRNLYINLLSDNFLGWRGSGVQSLHIRDTPTSVFNWYKTKISIPLRYVIKTNKHIKSLRLDEKNLPPSVEIFKQIKYLTSISSIEMNRIPLMDQKEYHRLLQGSKFSLKSITFTSSLSCPMEREYMAFNKLASIQLFRVILELPCLQKIDFSTDDFYRFYTDKIPFNILRKRNISYTVNVVQKQELSLSTSNRIGLEDLEFLGVQFKDLWLRKLPRWDVFDEDYFKAREECKRVLLLDLRDLKRVDLLDLCLVCKNITTLEITLSCRNTTKGISFANLKKLHNLRSVFIELSSINKEKQVIREGEVFYEEGRAVCSEDLFRSLADCAQTLRSVHLHLDGEGLTEPENEVLIFFDACADTLIDFTLKCTFEPFTKSQNMAVFYNGLSRLKRLESMKIIYDELGLGNSFVYSKHLKTVLLNKNHLKEFYLLVPFIDSRNIMIDYAKLKSICKLSFNFLSTDISSEFLKKSTQFPELKHLELAASTGNREICEKILKALNRMQSLEVLFFDCHCNEELIKTLISGLELFFRSHSRLRFIAFGSSFKQEDIKIFIKKSPIPLPSVKEVDNYFGRNLQELPKKRNQKIFLCI